MADRDIIPLVADLVKASESYRDTLSADRIRAIEYYDGKMTDTPHDEGRSKVVSRDVRSTIQKVLPSLARVFLSSDQLVEYQPVEEGDDAEADQATDYVNHVIFPECNGEMVLTDAIYDALKLRNAVITWWYEEKATVSTALHTGLADDAFATLVNDESVTVLEHTERVEMIDAPAMPQMGPAMPPQQPGMPPALPAAPGMGMAPPQPPQKIPSTVHDVKIRRKTVERQAKLRCVPLEEFLIHPDALEEDAAPVIGSKTRVRRSELVAMGYDKDVVDNLPTSSGSAQQEDNERATRRRNADEQRKEDIPELEEVDYFDLLVRIDKDGDGIAELRHMCFGGKIAEDTVLLDEEADEVNYAIITSKREPHQWEGVSVADDTMDIQRVKTVLFRGTLDNLYWVNNQQLAAKRSRIQNPDALTNPQFGQTVWLEDDAGPVAEAIQPITVPFVAQQSFAMLDYLDHEIQERTGITDASGGLPEDALQNVTAKASALMEQKGIGQSELMARSLAVGFRRVFRGLLRLLIKHQDKPRTVRLRGTWVTFDPREWNAGMDCSVNTGLGAGTRERDMITMQGVLAIQEKILASMGPQNPYVTPEQLGNALTKFIEASGLKSPSLYVTKPTPEQIQAYQQAMASKPNPEQQKLQAQIEGQKQLKQIDVAAEQQTKQMEIAANRDKEIAQSRAAVEERQAISAIESQAADKDRLLKKYEIDKDHEVAMLNALLSNAQSPEVLAIVQGIVARLTVQNDGPPIMGMAPPQPKVKPPPMNGGHAQPMQVPQ